MTYPDYSGDWAYHPGVLEASITEITGNVITGLHIRRDTLLYADFAGAALGTSPGDTSWVMWGTQAEIQPQSTLTTTSPSATYTVIGSQLRGDLNQQQIILRKQA